MEIADILGTTNNVVSVTLSSQKKKKLEVNVTQNSVANEATKPEAIGEVVEQKT